MAAANQKGVSDDWIKANIKKQYNLDSKKDLKVSQFNAIMKYFESLKDKEKSQ